jgi:hypothetical protein
MAMNSYKILFNGKQKKKKHIKDAMKTVKEFNFSFDFVNRSGHKASNRVVGERVCKHKYSAYCVDDIDDVSPNEECSDMTPHNAVASEASENGVPAGKL